MYDIIEIINSCFEACIIMFYLDRSLGGKRRYGKISIVIASIFIAVLLSLAALTGGNPTIQIITTFFLMLGASSAIYDERWIKKTVYSRNIYSYNFCLGINIYVSALSAEFGNTRRSQLR